MKMAQLRNPAFKSANWKSEGTATWCQYGAIWTDVHSGQWAAEKLLFVQLIR